MKNRLQKKGFSLVELLIAIAVFAVVATFALGSVVSVVNAGRKARSLASVMTNVDSTLEVMSREIKFGSHFHCVLQNETLTFPLSPQNCTGNSVAAQSEFAFVTSDGINTVYRLNGTAIQKSSDGGTTWIAVTAPEVVVQSLQFYVFGSAPQSVTPADNAQPRVIIVIRGYAGTKPSAESNFVLQTMVSQRILDITPAPNGINGQTGGTGGNPTPPVLALVQQATTASGNVTLASAPAAGDTLVLLVHGGASSVSGGGVSWTEAVTDSYYVTDQIWYGTNASGSGSNVITISGGTNEANVSEWSGVSSVSPLDASPAVERGGYGAVFAGPVTPTTGANDLIIAVGVNSGGALNSGPTGGFVALSHPNLVFDAAYQIISSVSGSYSTAWDHGGSNWGSLMIALKAGS